MKRTPVSPAGGQKVINNLHAENVKLEKEAVAARKEATRYRDEREAEKKKVEELEKKVEKREGFWREVVKQVLKDAREDLERRKKWIEEVEGKFLGGAVAGKGSGKGK
jgi:predicted  nucleic acid-binding Zn-ribbon protein